MKNKENIRFKTDCLCELETFVISPLENRPYFAANKLKDETDNNYTVIWSIAVDIMF